MALDEAGLVLKAEGSGEFIDALGRAHDARGRFIKGLSDAGPQSQGASQIITGALRQVGVVAVDAALQAGKAIVGFVTDSIGVAGDFEAGMNRFAAVTGDALTESGMSIKQFRDLFLQLGKDTQYSAAQAEEAAINLAKGGLDPLTISSTGLKGTLDLAAASEMDLANASEIMAKQLGVWASEGVTGADVANLLSQAANASTVDVEDLALGLANAGGSAKVAGVDFRDLTTTMALIAPGFSSAADAGTALKTFISRMIPTTKSQTAAMVELGLATADGKSAFFDARGQFIGMEKAAQMLQNATKSLTKEQRLQYLQTIFGNDAIRAAAAIAEAGAEGFDKMGDSMDKAGTAAEQAAKRQIGFAFAQEQLKGSLETLQIVLGTQLLPVLTDFLNNIVTPGINTIMSFSQGFLDASDKVGFLKGAFEQLIPGGAGIVDMFVNVAAQMQQLVNNIITAITTGDTTPLVTMLQGWAGLFLNWVTTDVLPYLGAKISEIATAVQGWVASNVPGILAKLSEWGNAFLTWVKAIVIPNISAKLAEIVPAVQSFITNTVPKFVEKLKEWGNAFLGWVSTSVLPVITQKADAISKAVTGWISEQAPKFRDKLKSWGDEFLVWVRQLVVPNIGAKLDEIWPAISAWISAQGTKISAQVSTWATAFTDWITKEALPALPGKLVAFWTGLYEEIKKLAANITVRSSELAESLVSWIAEKAVPWLQTEFPKIALVIIAALLAIPAALVVTLAVVALAIVNGIVEGVNRFVQAKVGELIQSGSAVVSSLARGMEQTKGQVNQVFINLGNDMTLLWTNIKNTVNGIWEGIKTLVNNAITWVRNTVNSITQGISSDVATLWTGITTNIQTALDNIKKAVSDEFNRVKDSIVNAITTAINGIGALLGDFYNKGKAIIDNIVSGINAIGGRIRDAVMGFVNGAVSSAVNAINSAIDGIRNTLNGIQSWIGNLRSQISNLFGSGSGSGAGNSVFAPSRNSSVSPAASGMSLMNSRTYNNSYTRNYQLSVNSQLPVNSIRMQFAVLEALGA